MSDALRILRPAEWREQAWRNGGGVTHEIASAHDGDVLLWRLSTARVERDGAYSLFPGLVRISTAIEGPGTRLRDMETGIEIDIPPLSPTALDGDALYEGSLKSGPIRHLNLVYDPARIVADVQMLRASGSDCSPAPGETRMIFCVTGIFEMQDMTLHAHETLIGPADFATPRLGPDALGVAITLSRVVLEPL